MVVLVVPGFVVVNMVVVWFSRGPMVVIMVTLRRRAFGGQADAKLIGAGSKFVNPGPFEGILGLKETRIEIGGAAEIESADIEHAVDGNVAVARPVNPGRGIHAVQAGFEPVEVGGAGEVGLVEEQDVGKGDLLLRLLAVVKVPGGISGVDDGDDAVQPVGAADLRIGEEGLGNWAGVGKAGGLDQHAI